MATALLILVGGRPTPNMLTVIHEHPQLIVSLVSKDVVKQKELAKDAIIALSKDEPIQPEIDDSYMIDAFNKDDVKQKCLEAIENHPGYEWIFNITSATTIMSIGAYEAAKELQAQGHLIRCWYLDTSHTRVIPLIGEGRDDQIFHITIHQYATIYNCRLGQGDLEDRRQHCQDHWLPFTSFLVTKPDNIDILKKILRHIDSKSGKPSKEESKQCSISPLVEETYTLLQQAYKVNLLKSLARDNNKVVFEITYEQYNFLNGPWLEAYVWNKAWQTKLFSDCQWNLRILDKDNLNDKENKNELDVALAYRAQLLIAECKTSEDPFNAEILYKLDSIAHILGHNFVGKLLVTSQPSLENSNNHTLKRKYEKFMKRAEERGVVVVTREGLEDIQDIIIQQAKNPKRARI